MSDFDYGVFIGRFQPLHAGHEHVIHEALKRVESLIIVIGSATSARTTINPFTFEERKRLLIDVFKHEWSAGRLRIIGVADNASNDDWKADVESAVGRIVLEDLGGEKRESAIALAGYGKDETSFYLDLFPEWASIQLGTSYGKLSATSIREEYLRYGSPTGRAWKVSPSTQRFLDEFVQSEPYWLLRYEQQYYDGYQTIWGPGPFLCADALVKWNDHVLLVTRGKIPGKGLLAMPGGHLNEGETFLDAALRELEEETGLVIRENWDVLHQPFIADAPRRSLRGRVISLVQPITLIAEHMPNVAGADDAAHAAFYPIHELRQEQFFEDHWFLINRFI